MAKLMAAQGKAVPDYTKHIACRLPAALEACMHGDHGAKPQPAAPPAAAAPPAPAAAPKPKKQKKQKK
jgi:hypothetical protein